MNRPGRASAWPRVGRTGTGDGELQRFFIPAAATRLFFGFLDSTTIGGPPSSYHDNTGAVTGVLRAWR
ncbi:MAG: hypothetical protein HY903_04335 [Deltaproteobacteria bacterium]|nr:hypothetical protein [Deltaproteobacteria bacterium]